MLNILSTKNGQTRHILRICLLAVIGFSIIITSCGTTFRFKENVPENTEDTFKTGKIIEQGVASWYGSKFHGNLTANGEIYNMHELTAAHRTLPFGTILKVKNLDNGKSVKVRINDRGPYAKNRIIDLSKKAATKIGMINTGTANVSLVLLEGEINEARTPDLKVATFTVQLASFFKQEKAERFSNKIKGSRVEEFDLEDRKVFRVFYGTFTNKKLAQNKQRELQLRGIEGYVKQIQNY